MLFNIIRAHCLGDSRLQYVIDRNEIMNSCDLRLGDSRLQYARYKRSNTGETLIFSSQKNESCSGAFSIGKRFLP